MLKAVTALKMLIALATLPALLALTFGPKTWTTRDAAPKHDNVILLANR
jgi:hypothetical protein